MWDQSKEKGEGYSASLWAGAWSLFLGAPKDSCQIKPKKDIMSLFGIYYMLSSFVLQWQMGVHKKG